MRLWRFLPGPAKTLPVAVILNRFLTEDLVFILGILTLLSVVVPEMRRREGEADTSVAAGHAHSRPGRANKGGSIAAAGSGRKTDARRGGGLGW
jgi:hypothetical protein